jgi:hypothetical protein
VAVNLMIPGSIRKLALVLLVSSAWAQKKPPAPKAPNPKAHPERSPGGGPPAPHRASEVQIDKLAKMNPAERQKALAALPAERRQKLESRLSKLDNLTPEERARRESQLEKFNSLPPDQQLRVRQLSKKIQALPDDRRQAVRRELSILRNIPDDERAKRIGSPEFQKRFSAEEQEILRDSPSLVPEHF